MKIMLTALLAGLLGGGYGLYLLLFKPLVDETGMGDIFLVVGLITVGAFLFVPAKICIIIKLTMRERNRKTN